MSDKSAAGTITERENGWLQAKVPLPFSLKWVNAYLLPDTLANVGEGEDEGNRNIDCAERKWTLIDPGLRTEEIERFWEDVLAERGIGWDRIGRIVLTHHHPDHYGMAGWLQEKTGASVWMSRTAHANAERLWGDGETFSDELTDAFVLHGLAGELVEAMQDHMKGFVGKVTPMPVGVHALGAGDSIRMGGADWRVLGGEGHAPGHLMFYDEAGGRLICGDQVLPDITPNIGWMPGGDPDPLGSFMESLSRLAPLQTGIVYPGHRDPFSEFGKRVEEILEHHERRVGRMSELLVEGSKTAFEACESLFGSRLRGNMHNLRFALAETIAHLVYMERRGLAKRETGSFEGREVIRWTSGGS